ncbi:MAG: NAD(P)H-hydrate dehydratase [Bacteroidales bacterium]|nr:NAD(P)H-hydrate dehydratase [Bacteroidales bacterium]
MKIFTSPQIAEIDKYTLQCQDIDEYALVKRVAKQLAEWLKNNILKIKREVVIFAGPGNNGNDAIALAASLGSRNINCTLYLIKPQKFKKEIPYTRRALVEELYMFGNVIVKEINEPEDVPLLPKKSLIIDGIFGTGISKSVEGIYCHVIEAINNSECDVVSIDVPSGLLSDVKNEDCSAAIVKADFTLTLQFPKLCMFFKENYIYTGNWVVIDIGLDLEIMERMETPYNMIDEESIRRILKKRGKYSHKGDYGHGLLVAGSLGMAGSAVLAAIGALRSGLGLITVHVPNRLYDILQISVPEAICTTDPSDTIFTSLFEKDLDKFSAVAVGPGLGKAPETVSALRELVAKCNKPMVIDADAINIISVNREILKDLPTNSVLTPHPKEFSRIAGDSVDSREAVEKQVRFSAQNNVTVVLKGANTSVSTPDGELWFNSTGNPGMATAGSGDVLGGVILGLMSQGYCARDAAIAGVYIHSLAGDIVAAKFGEESLISRDIASHLGEAFKRIC